MFKTMLISALILAPLALFAQWGQVSLGDRIKANNTEIKFRNHRDWSCRVNLTTLGKLMPGLFELRMHAYPANPKILKGYQSFYIGPQAPLNKELDILRKTSGNISVIHSSLTMNQKGATLRFFDKKKRIRFPQNNIKLANNFEISIKNRRSQSALDLSCVKIN